MREEWGYAGFLDRLFADFFDGLFIAIAGSLGYFLIDRQLLRSDPRLAAGDFGAGEAAVLIWMLWNMTYLVGKTGQSWGRQVASIKVVGRDGEPIGFWRALGRNLFAMYISALPLYLSFLWVIWDREKQAWHDKVFRTYVLRLVQR